MLPAIKLDHELRLEIDEIDDVFFNRPLAAKAEAFQLFIANVMPAYSFCVGGVFA
jgi:hypothetical protein